jgi:hypothetical protein
VRAAVFAAACVLLSASTYAVAGHGSAPLWALLVGFAAVFPFAWAGSARVRGTVAICAGTALVQLGLDYWFSLAQIDAPAVRGCGIIDVLPPMGETVNCAHTATALAPTLAPDGSVHVNATVLGVQLIVAVIAALPLALGEHAQLALRQIPHLRDAFARLLPRLILAAAARPAAPHTVRRTPVRETRKARPQRPDLRHALVRRGPPPAAALG